MRRENIMGELKIKRIYEAFSPEDGERILVDRLWPRGIRKEKSVITRWEKNIAPSGELRKWFGHDPERFSEFARKYRNELDNNPEAAGFGTEVQASLEKGNVTLLYSAKDTEHNNAAVLAGWIKAAYLP